MSFNEGLILTAFILVIVDFFIQNDYSTHIAYIILSYVITTYVDAEVLYKVIAGLLSWFILVCIHYAFWRGIIQKVNDRFISKDIFLVGADNIIGKQGQIISIENHIRT